MGGGATQVLGAAPHTPYPVSGHAQRACAPACPTPSRVLAPPPLFCLPCAWRAHCWGGGAPITTLVQPPPPSLLHDMHRVRTLHFGGVSPFLLPVAAHRGIALPGWGVPLSPARACVVGTNIRGDPPHIPPLGCALGEHTASLGWTPCSSARAGFARTAK